MLWVKGKFPSCNHTPLFSRESPTNWVPWFFYCRFPSSSPTKNTWVISAFCFLYINKYLIVTLSEQWLVPGSKVPLPLAKCCICCPSKLHPEQSPEKAETCSWRWGTTGGITSHWWKMELGFNHETTAQVSRGWETGASVMPKLINRNHSKYFLHEGINLPRRWGMSTAPIAPETGKKLEWQVLRLAHTVEKGTAPSLPWKDNSEGKGETSMPRNITPRFVCFPLLSVNPGTLQSWAAGAGHWPRTAEPGPQHPAGTHFLNGHCPKTLWEKLHDTSYPQPQPDT